MSSSELGVQPIGDNTAYVIDPNFVYRCTYLATFIFCLLLTAVFTCIFAVSKEDDE